MIFQDLRSNECPALKGLRLASICTIYSIHIDTYTYTYAICILDSKCEDQTLYFTVKDLKMHELYIHQYHMTSLPETPILSVFLALIIHPLTQQERLWPCAPMASAGTSRGNMTQRLGQWVHGTMCWFNDGLWMGKFGKCTQFLKGGVMTWEFLGWTGYLTPDLCVCVSKTSNCSQHNIIIQHEHRLDWYWMPLIQFALQMNPVATFLPSNSLATAPHHNSMYEGLHQQW